MQRKIGCLGTTCEGWGLGLESWEDISNGAVNMVIVLWLCPSISPSHKVIELRLQGSGHLVGFRAAALLLLLVGVLGRLVSGVLLPLILCFFSLGFIKLSFVSPGEKRRDGLEVVPHCKTFYLGGSHTVPPLPITGFAVFSNDTAPSAFL